MPGEHGPRCGNGHGLCSSQELADFLLVETHVVITEHGLHEWWVPGEVQGW